MEMLREKHVNGINHYQDLISNGWDSGYCERVIRGQGNVSFAVCPGLRQKNYKR